MLYSLPFTSRCKLRWSSCQTKLSSTELVKVLWIILEIDHPNVTSDDVRDTEAPGSRVQGSGDRAVTQVMDKKMDNVKMECIRKGQWNVLGLSFATVRRRGE